MVSETEPLPAEAEIAAPPHPLREFWGYFSANPGAVAGLATIIFVVLLAIFADVVSPHSPIATHDNAFLKPPFWAEGGSLTYPLGSSTARASRCSSAPSW